MCPSSLSSFDEQFSTLPSSEDSVSLHFPESPLKQLTPLVEGSTHSAARGKGQPAQPRGTPSAASQAGPWSTGTSDTVLISSMVSVILKTGILDYLTSPSNISHLTPQLLMHISWIIHLKGSWLWLFKLQLVIFV